MLLLLIVQKALSRVQLEQAVHQPVLLVLQVAIAWLAAHQPQLVQQAISAQRVAMCPLVVQQVDFAQLVALNHLHVLWVVTVLVAVQLRHCVQQGIFVE